MVLHRYHHCRNPVDSDVDFSDAASEPKSAYAVIAVVAN